MHNWQAQWIWLDQPDRRPRNQTIIARKTVELPEMTSATLAITADTQYRLFINGQWIEDGPCRSWPKHYQYDVIDVAGALRPGRNTIVVIARHFGISTFHQVPQEAGLLVQLDMVSTTGEALTVVSDESWRVHESEAHLRNTVRMSIQHEQTEWYDATREFAGVTEMDFDDANWPLAKAYHAAEAGPWQDLHPRDVRFLTKEPVSPIRLAEASVVTGAAHTVAFDIKRLCYPNDLSSNAFPVACVFSTLLISERAQTIRVFPLAWWGIELFCNGEPVLDNQLILREGENLFSFLILGGGHTYVYSLGFQTWDGVSQCNPMDANDPNPWAWVEALETFGKPTGNTAGDFLSSPEFARQTVRGYAGAPDAQTLRKRAGDRYRPIPAEEMLLHDSNIVFQMRQIVRSADELIENRGALLADNQEWTTVSPAADGDVELCLDLGKQAVGWVEFDLVAPEGTAVDVNLIEYRDRQMLQYTGDNRNGFRYITHAGRNTFVSMKRRAGRYLFLSLREMTAPVKIRMVRMVQATYPVELRGAFRCSDTTLTKIWEISAYTLRLCMEDTYTDCPLYEQTMWVGDARNESLYSAICYGADDITLRCLRLTAQSLDHLPITGCQVPSGWDILLPAWSFLWGINVWEYYFTSGDRAGLAELYPAVMKNLRAAKDYCTDHGLFSLDAWNLFDWAGIDQGQRTVVHNSLFLLGAIDAAQQCCDTLGAEDGPWLGEFYQELHAAVLAMWDDARQSYPDSIRNDGAVSPSICQHTSALGVLYDALPDGCREVAVRNVIDPPEGMVRVGSPFALQFFLEALEKAGKAPEIVRMVRTLWEDMLACDATTCWETFRGYESSYPTRSHCHAWSSAPIYVFNRLVLGIVPVAVGAAEVVVSPHPLDLAWAEGATTSPKGELRVAWQRKDDTLALTVTMPAGVNWRVEPNADWHGITHVTVNGEERADLVPAYTTA